MNTLIVEAQPREPGKKSSRALRRSGSVPCVVYGMGETTVPFHVAASDLHRLVFTGERSRVELRIGKDSYDCILKEVDFNPTTDMPIHADFQMLREGVAIELSIPVQYVGKSKGQIEGGDLDFLVHELDIETLPKNIPDHLSVDISDLDIGDTIHVSDLSFEGITIVTPPSQSLVTCFVRRVVEEVVEEVEGVEGEMVEEGAEGAGEEDGDEAEKSEKSEKSE